MKPPSSQKLPTTDELSKLLRSYSSGHHKSKKLLCDCAARIQPNFAKLMRRNLKCGGDFPDNIDILSVLAARAIEEHPDLYRIIRDKQTKAQIGTGLQWDNACRFGIPLNRIDPTIFRLILDCEPPLDTPMWTEQTTPRFPTQYYVVPQGMLQVDKTPILLIGTSFFNPIETQAEGDAYSCRLGYPPFDFPTDRGLLMIIANTGTGEEYYTRQPVINGSIVVNREFTDHTGRGITTDELGLQQKLLSLGLQLLLLENTYPVWHSEEKIIQQGTGSGKMLAEYRPRLIGGNFPHRHLVTGKREADETETGRKKPCEHWRGSHWKTVHFGERRQYNRRKLILPYLVNPGFD